MTNSDPWLPFGIPIRPGVPQLFCFPYAGGAAAAYRGWIPRFGTNVEPLPLEFPGHGSRILELPARGLVELVDALCSALAPHLRSPFAFFGHSLGAILAYEAALRIRAQGRQTPTHLFVSGARAPHRFGNAPDKWLHDLAEPELIAAVRELGGTPAEVLDNPELITLLMPTLRADFELCDRYSLASPAVATPTIVALSGESDAVAGPSEMEHWRWCAADSFQALTFRGGHFFIREHEHEICHAIESTLSSITPRDALSRRSDVGQAT
jgi:surfactin synthase thioesterase subunit